MSTIFGSFEIGRKALRAQHKGMEVSGQNVANANTPGYSRQRADMAAVPPIITASGVMAPGNGVLVTDIARIRSDFYHAQIVSTSSHQSYWEMRRETFHGVEAIFMEPEEYGINKYLGDFFDRWQELSTSPEETAVRNGLVESAVSLAYSIEDVYLRLEDLRMNLSEELHMRVEEANRIAHNISEMNDKIRFVGTMQQKSNELLDQLDLAVEELAGLIDIRFQYKSNGTVEIFTGGSIFVQEDRVFEIRVDAGGVDRGLEVMSHRGFALNLDAGRIKGLLDAVNLDIPGLQDKLNRIAATITEEVNGLHLAGYGINHESGAAFFDTSVNPDLPAALNFKVNQAVIDDPSLVAASSSAGEPGNGENALAIARLRDSRGGAERLNSASIIEYYRGVVTSMGVQAQESGRMMDAFGRTEAQLVELHQSVSGVNLDEEMLNMIQFQHAWHAAARYLNYVDQMLTMLFTELGR